MPLYLKNKRGKVAAIVRFCKRYILWQGDEIIFRGKGRNLPIDEIDQSTQQITRDR